MRRSPFPSRPFSGITPAAMNTVARALAPALCLALCVVPALAHADDVERQGGRVGVSLLLGGAVASGDSASASIALGGVAIRFGGAFTDRFHLMGELTLAAMPGGNVRGLGDVTGLHPALALLGEGYIGPRFFIRGGVGAGWATATTGNSWYLPLPGPRFSGGVGYALWRSGERQFSLAFDVAYTMLFNASTAFDRLVTAGLHVGFDWY